MIGNAAADGVEQGAVDGHTVGGEPRWRAAVIVAGLAGVLGLGVLGPGVLGYGVAGHGTLHHTDRVQSDAPYCEIVGASPPRANVAG